MYSSKFSSKVLLLEKVVNKKGGFTPITPSHQRCGGVLLYLTSPYGDLGVTGTGSNNFKISEKTMIDVQLLRLNRLIQDIKVMLTDANDMQYAICK